MRASFASRLRRDWATLPPLARAGVMVIGVGTVADVLAHATAPSTAVGFTPLQQAGHLAILIGMVYTLAGILIDALYSRRPPANHQQIKGGPHAHR